MVESYQAKGLLLIVSGPAGSGKTTLCDRMLAEVSGLQRVITSTTRPPRESETDKVDYYFFNKETFKAKIEAGDFYEYAQVHTNLYGTLKSEIQDKLSAGDDLLLNIDVQGAATFRETAQVDPLLKGHVCTVFLLPPSIEELESRLHGRGSDDDAEIARRMQVARDELKQAKYYDHCIESSTRENDFRSLLAIYLAAKA